jgi:hypothetical protein
MPGRMRELQSHFADDLTNEAEWILKSLVDDEKHKALSDSGEKVDLQAAIAEIIKLLRFDMLEVPFIMRYRKGLLERAMIQPQRLWDVLEKVPRTARYRARYCVRTVSRAARCRTRSGSTCKIARTRCRTCGFRTFSTPRRRCVSERERALAFACVSGVYRYPYPPPPPPHTHTHTLPSPSNSTHPTAPLPQMNRTESSLPTHAPPTQYLPMARPGAACRHTQYGMRTTCHAQVLTEMKLLKPVAEYATGEFCRGRGRGCRGSSPHHQSDAPKQLEKTLRKALVDARIITDGGHRFPG